MKTAFFPKLALDSIRKNSRVYIPYWITCQLCVCIFYLLNALTCNPVIRNMQGGGSTVFILNLGCIVIGIFSAIFLFYTSTLLVRRRKREFGLYSVLGMNRASVGRIMLWETLITAAVTLTAGLLAGIVLSKLGELLLVRIVGDSVRNGFFISGSGILRTVFLFGLIFLLLLLSGIRQVRFSTVTDLLRSEHTGEKPPKANYVPAVLGLLMLGAAYGLAVTIREPLTALLLFFAAVILVIAATYLLMISGSVALCRVLQKCRNYYYRTRHFISVSFMAYRMKRNGAGLAGICVLATMVLVMISSTACLFFGAEDTLYGRYPREFDAELRFSTFEGTDGITEDFRDLVGECAAAEGIVPDRIMDYRCASVTGLLDGRNAVLDPDAAGGDLFRYDKVVTFNFIDSNEYNRSAAEKITVPEGELLFFSPAFPVQEGSLYLGDTEFTVRRAPDSFEYRLDTSVAGTPDIFLITDDLAGTVAPLTGLTDTYGQPVLNMSWQYAFDTHVPADAQAALVARIGESVSGLQAPLIRRIFTYREAERTDYYGSFGGFFFLGILLSIVFLAATAIIIYYKQLSEGYEDQGRFDILRKVGMTREDIRASVSSQMRTVFFFPLGLAVLHLCFAFPMIRKLLMLFGLNNLPLLLAATGGAVALFAVFYIIVYRYTAGVYYRLVAFRSEK